MANIERVKVANGFVEGQVINVLGTDVVQFLCIPYCKPPVKELRFQKPQSCDSFLNEVINKLKFETCPPQILDKPYDSENKDEDIWIPKETEDEDSLYVNVWCPLHVLKGDHKQAVLIFIYGGGFVSGSSSLDIYNGSLLCGLENIIVVSFNYRIAMLGFLCLDDQVTGNLGIWDQMLALKWIYENITAFNGDRDNMTLAGNSAGACSVSLHLLIEDSWPYFSKAVMQSGVCLSNWGFLPREELNRRSIVCVNAILKKHEFPLEWSSDLSNENKRSIMKFLQEIDFKEFLVDYDETRGIVQFAWAACVDGVLIKDNPKTLYESGQFKKCPTIFLNVENEGSVFIMLKFPNISVDDSNSVPVKYFYDSLKYYPHFPKPCEDDKVEKVKKEYKIEGEKFPIRILDKVIGDEYFVCGSLELANIVSRFHQEVFFLWFNVPSSSVNWADWCGVMHSEEIYYLFGEMLKMNPELVDYQKDASRLLMKQFGQFMLNGNFLEKMPKYDETSRRYISIERNGWTSRRFSDEQFAKVAFWNNL